MAATEGPIRYEVTRTIDADADTWAAAIPTMCEWIVDGRAEFHRGGVPLDVATVERFGPADLVGLTLVFHDRNLGLALLQYASEAGELRALPEVEPGG